MSKGGATLSHELRRLAHDRIVWTVTAADCCRDIADRIDAALAEKDAEAEELREAIKDYQACLGEAIIKVSRYKNQIIQLKAEQQPGPEIV